MSVLSGKDSSILECFRPRGKIVCVGESLSSELQIIQDFINIRGKARLPLLLLTPSSLSDNICDQVVKLDSELVIKQVYSLLNSYFLIFIFNSSEEGIFRVLGTIMASIDYSGTIPIFIDTSRVSQSGQKSIFGKCYFNLDISDERGKLKFKILLDCLISSLSSTTGIGASFSDLIRVFGKSKSLFYGISSSNELDIALKDSIDQVGEKLILALPEEIEHLETILVVINSESSLSLQIMNNTSLEMINTFGKDFEVYFSSSIDANIKGYNIVIILTDLNPIENVFSFSSSTDTFTTRNIAKRTSLNDAKKLPQNSDPSEISDEDERFDILSKIFSNSEIYIFDDGGLPLFASHRPAGQEVCLYTGLFSAIQSMSSDLIGHTPDHLTAGNKRCVFISKPGPGNSQLRGVAICSEGFEQHARNDLKISMNLVKNFMEHGEPEYAINDKMQGFLVQGFNSGTLGSIFQNSSFHAS
ncbi:MAG: hypothetical protein ACFFAU_02745 [Candidatus Hodarchaeota archaeon]